MNIPAKNKNHSELFTNQVNKKETSDKDDSSFRKQLLPEIKAITSKTPLDYVLSNLTAIANGAAFLHTNTVSPNKNSLDCLKFSNAFNENSFKKQQQK